MSETCPTCNYMRDEFACCKCGIYAGQHSSLAAMPGCAVPIPDVLFDGNAVWQALDERARTRTSAENISDVLDAVVRLMREPAQHNVELSHTPPKSL